MRASSSAVAAPRDRNRHPLDQRDALGGGPVANDGEPDRPIFAACNEIGMAGVGERDAMLALVPLADQAGIARPPLGRHHERHVGGARARNQEWRPVSHRKAILTW